MYYTSDWHIHCEGSYDASLTVPHILQKAEEYGITELGITDHVNAPSWITYLKKSRELFDANRRPGFHFGVELTTQSKPLFDYAVKNGGAEELWLLRRVPNRFEPYQGYELPLTEEELRSLKVEYVIGGVHWPCFAPYTREDIIKDYSLQNLYLACDPRVDIVAHPWDFDCAWQNDNGIFDTLPWYDDFEAIPHSVHEEFAAAMKENGKCMEWNLCFIVGRQYPEAFKRRYAEYVREMFELGVPITLGSDAHDEYPNCQDAVQEMACRVGFEPQDFARPSFRAYEE